MAYSTGSATDLGDLLTKLDVFMVANGWTQDQFDDGVTAAGEGIVAWHKNSIYISAKWIASAPGSLSLHQALGFIATTTDPGGHTDDSGNGYNNAFGSDANLRSERCCSDIGDGPFVSYHFFEQDASPAYVHIVVEIESEIFRHFGWGELDKFNDWTGGEYCYGQQQDTATNGHAADTATTSPFDALQSASTNATAREGTTIHMEGFAHQGVNEKWLSHMGAATSIGDADNLDTAGELRQISFGGFRGGPLYHLMQFQSDVLTGHIPLTPWAIFLNDYGNNFAYFLGSVPDIRSIDITNFSPGQEVTIGSDVWVVFPSGRRTTDGVLSRTYFQGIAYKKVTA
tara:strand:- start:55425 stop:56450 length:1026 start_codon:yes stop_codon:yes gene_type:complete